jgi:SWI/SNF-related matrix-associated actin-dependent regulator of chromatin subfamily A member 5
MNTGNRLLITGTPLQNNLHELWALLNFLLPDIFHNSNDFTTWVQSGDGRVEQLHRVLGPFLLRRVKSQVEKSLVPKKKVNIYVGMSSMQKRWYQKILEKNIDAVNGAVNTKKAAKTRLLNIVMQLRKCCNHPYLFEGAEPGPPYTTDQHIIENSGKMIVLDRLLAHIKERGSRVLLFSQMSRVLDILEDFCLWKGFAYCRIDGNTAHEDRIKAIDEYNAPGSPKFIFLLTTRAGGLGINLTTADVCIMYDADYNPQVDLQAEDRAHRIGQTKQVIVYRLVTENSIEEKVLERAQQKLQLDKMVIQSHLQHVGAAGGVEKENASNYLAMIQHGAENIFQSTEATATADFDVDELLRRSEEKTQELDQKYENAKVEDLLKLDHSAYEWDGQDYRKKQDLDEWGKLKMGWIGPGKRERRVNNYSVVEALRVAPPAKKIKIKVQPPLIPEYQFYPPQYAELHCKNYYFQLVRFQCVAIPISHVFLQGYTF